MQSRAVLSVLCGLVLAGSVAQGAEAVETWRPEPLPRNEEIEEALAACPAKLRQGAGVYVLTVILEENIGYVINHMQI